MQWSLLRPATIALTSAVCSLSVQKRPPNAYASSACGCPSRQHSAWPQCLYIGTPCVQHGCAAANCSYWHYRRSHSRHGGGSQQRQGAAAAAGCGTCRCSGVTAACTSSCHTSSTAARSLAVLDTSSWHISWMPHQWHVHTLASCFLASCYLPCHVQHCATCGVAGLPVC